MADPVRPDTGKVIETRVGVVEVLVELQGGIQLAELCLLVDLLCNKWILQRSITGRGLIALILSLDVSELDSLLHSLEGLYDYFVLLGFFLKLR